MKENNSPLLLKMSRLILSSVNGTYIVKDHEYRELGIIVYCPYSKAYVWFQNSNVKLDVEALQEIIQFMEAIEE